MPPWAGSRSSAGAASSPGPGRSRRAASRHCRRRRSRPPATRRAAARWTASSSKASTSCSPAVFVARRAGKPTSPRWPRRPARAAGSSATRPEIPAPDLAPAVRQRAYRPCESTHVLAPVQPETLVVRRGAHRGAGSTVTRGRFFLHRVRRGGSPYGDDRDVVLRRALQHAARAGRRRTPPAACRRARPSCVRARAMPASRLLPCRSTRPSVYSSTVAPGARSTHRLRRAASAVHAEHQVADRPAEHA